MAKIKLQITMDEDLLQSVDDYCDKNYMNRSCLISQSLIEVLNRQKLIDSISNVSLALKKCSEIGSIDEETRSEMQSFEALCKIFVK